MVRQVDSKEEYDQVVEEAADKLIVMDFYATWCGPCKLMGPKFEVSTTYKFRRTSFGIVSSS